MSKLKIMPEFKVNKIDMGMSLEQRVTELEQIVASFTFETVKTKKKKTGDMVVDLRKQGLSQKKIAKRLNISVATVCYHLGKLV